MTYNLPNGSTWDLSLSWYDQEQDAQTWMDDAVRYGSNSLKYYDPFKGIYTCVIKEDVEVCLTGVKVVKSIK